MCVDDLALKKHCCDNLSNFSINTLIFHGIVQLGCNYQLVYQSTFFFIYRFVISMSMLATPSFCFTNELIILI